MTVEAEDEIPSAPRRRQKSEQETVSERREYLASAHPPSQTVGIFCPEVATPRTKTRGRSTGLESRRLSFPDFDLKFFKTFRVHM